MTKNKICNKLKGWVARDSIEMGYMLHFFKSKPLRNKGRWDFGGKSNVLIDEFMEDITWKDEPIEIEIIFKTILKWKKK